MLEDVSGDKEVYRSFEFFIDGAKIQFWFLMVIGINVTEFPRQAIGITLPVADTQPYNVASNWEL